MSDENQSDDPIQRILLEADDGLKAPGPDRPAGDKPTRSGADRAAAGSPRGNGALPRGPRARHDPLPLWLLAAAAVVVVLLIVMVVMYVSQTDRLKTLEHQVVALQQRGGAAGIVEKIRPRLQRLDSRLDALDTRVKSGGGEADIEAVKQLVTDQGAKIESLSRQVAELEHKRAVSGKTGTASGSGGATGSATGAAGGGGTQGSWVVNLIAVADASSANRFEKQLTDMGVKSRIDIVDIGGKTLRRVVATGFDSEEDAKSFAASIKKQLGLAEVPWVSRD